MAAGIFREQALERLSSPEQLDQAMRVAKPTGWLAIGLFLVLTVVAAVWATVSTAPIMVRGQGILIQMGGVVDIVSASDGRLLELSVDTGTRVEKGQLVAVIALPEQEQKLVSARKALQELEDQRSRVTDLQTRDRSSRKSFARMQRTNLEQTIGFLNERLRSLEERQAAQEMLWEKRLIAKQLVVEARLMVTTAKEQIAKAKSDIEGLDVADRQREDQNEHELMALSLQIGNARRTVGEYEVSLRENGQVRATAGGTVAETKVSPGDVVGRGMPLFSLVSGKGNLPARDGLVAEMFIAAADGKKVKPGMAVLASPSTVKREQYGSILGTVRTVADIPATSEGMMRLLKNRQLVQELSQGGAPIKIEVELESADTPSGFHWSSSRGPELVIDQGTLVSALITIRRVRLITMMFPMLEPLLPNPT
ncbi:MAG: NHLP bacteriocin system secretion protein [Rhodospirillaceae bacterium]